MLRTGKHLAVLPFSVVLMTGCALFSPRGITESNLDEKIAQANAPADHAALADYYEEQARQAEQDAAVRRAARHNYERWPPGIYHPPGVAASVIAHYDQLIAGYEQTAKENHALAQWHRALAQGQGGEPPH